MLQRRLASSPEAISKSLERRRRRLERRRREMATAGGAESAMEQTLRQRLAELLGRELPEDLDEIDDLASGEKEELESEVADAATAAQTVAELDHEITLLGGLEELARRVRNSGTDRKWTELRDLLSENALIRDGAGNLRKIIIFTEHRDTLDYLAERIRGHLGQPEAVGVIHGGVRREERRKVMELFAQDPEGRVLVATAWRVMAVSPSSFALLRRRRIELRADLSSCPMPLAPPLLQAPYRLRSGQRDRTSAGPDWSYSANRCCEPGRSNRNTGLILN